MNTLVSCGLQWELHQKGGFGPMYRIRLYQSQSTRTPTAASVTHFPSAALQQHINQNMRQCIFQKIAIIFFLSIVISPLRIYCGQERFWIELVELEKLWIFFLFFSASEDPDAASEKLYLTQWAGKPCESSRLSWSCLETHKLYNSLSLDTVLLLLLASDETMTWCVRWQAKKVCRGLFQNSERFGWSSSWRFLLMSHFHGRV